MSKRVISEGMLWKRLIEHMVLTNEMWKGLSERNKWYVPFVSEIFQETYQKWENCLRISEKILLENVFL